MKGKTERRKNIRRAIKENKNNKTKKNINVKQHRK